MPTEGRALPDILADQPPNWWPPVQVLEREPQSSTRWRCAWPGCDGRWRYEALVEHAPQNARGHYMRAHMGKPMPDAMLYPNRPQGSVIYEIEDVA